MSPIAPTQRIALIAGMLVCVAGAAQAQDFRLQIGPPAAVMPQPGTVLEKKVSKDVLFVVRPLGCIDPASVRITATAEGIVNGHRRSQMATLTALPTPGVHALSRSWPDGGIWVLSVAGTCAGRTAGAVVRLGPRDVYQRDGVELLAHHPAREQIDRALRASSADAGAVALTR